MAGIFFSVSFMVSAEELVCKKFIEKKERRSMPSSKWSYYFSNNRAVGTVVVVNVRESFDSYDRSIIWRASLGGVVYEYARAVNSLGWEVEDLFYPGSYTFKVPKYLSGAIKSSSLIAVSSKKVCQEYYSQSELKKYRKQELLFDSCVAKESINVPAESLGSVWSMCREKSKNPSLLDKLKYGL